MTEGRQNVPPPSDDAQPSIRPEVLEERAKRRYFRRLLDRSSIGKSAWVDCPEHGHQPRDPFTADERCVMCQ